MKHNFLNIYNNLIKLTRNKMLYLQLNKQDSFSDRLIILFFHFSFFLKINKSKIEKEELQRFFDYFIYQIELSIREIGYGDVSVNKKMKEFINILYLIIEKVESWNDYDYQSKEILIGNYLHINKNLDFYVNYFEKYIVFLSNNTLNSLSKDIINFKI